MNGPSSIQGQVGSEETAVHHKRATSSRPTRRRFSITASLAVAIALLAACGEGGGDGRANGGASDGTAGRPQNAVTMQLISFKPETVTVDAGTTVTWTQKDAGVHTVTAGTVEQGGGGVTKVPDGRFDSGEIATGKTFAFTFDQPGTYPYFCSVHPATMRGEVRVR